MKWMKYRLSTKVEAEDIVASILMDHGIEGVEILDNVPLTKEEQQGMFVGIMPEITSTDEKAYLVFYLSETKEDKEKLKEALSEVEEMRAFSDVGELKLEVSKTEDVDWVNNWKEYFHQFSINDILIYPSWEEPVAKENYKLLIEIDPGTAFGTGKHETTELAIRGIEKYLKPGMKLLDVGTGSGILSLVALKLGASFAFLTDLDENAVPAVKQNMENNQVSEKDYEVIIGNIIDDKKLQAHAGKENYEMIASNILAEILVPLTPVIYENLKKGGIFITSGIIEGKEEIVKESLIKSGMEIVEVNQLGEWFSIIARK
ncbi:MAG TPA: 50S ribosomal protein L11 methyltransferase [Candidatus Dorea intestinavium]|nr:50S ribosomal protein L11 methyltransferase [Candidatus Dorea intestinavium]